MGPWFGFHWLMAARVLLCSNLKTQLCKNEIHLGSFEIQYDCYCTKYNLMYVCVSAYELVAFIFCQLIYRERASSKGNEIEPVY